MRCLFVFDFVYFFFPLAVKLIGPRMGCQFFKIVDISVACPLKVLSCTPTYSNPPISLFLHINSYEN